VLSITFITDSATTDDALDNVCFVQGVERAGATLERLGPAEALFFLPRPGHRWRLVRRRAAASLAGVSGVCGASAGCRRAARLMSIWFQCGWDMPRCEQERSVLTIRLLTPTRIEGSVDVTTGGEYDCKKCRWKKPPQRSRSDFVWLPD